MQTYSGYTSSTSDHLLLDSGAFFKNFDIATDTPESAIAKLLGATRGGGEFNAKPTIRNIEVDGVKGDAKGLKTLDAWAVSIKANVLEVTAQTIKSALVAGDIDTSSNTDYDIITARNNIELTDYIDNITWIGTLSGSNKPVIIQVYNALCNDGLNLKTEDKKEAVVGLTFIGHYDGSDLQTPPFKIYYPKIAADTIAPTVSANIADAATGIMVGTNIVWTFSEPIQPPLVTSSNFIVMSSDGVSIAGTLNLNPDRTIVTFDPTANLAAATGYMAIVTTNVKDLAGNKLAATNVINFTTA